MKRWAYIYGVKDMQGRCFYVGCTTVGIAKRISNHRCIQSPVGRWMLSNEHEVQVLQRCTVRCGRDNERKWIARMARARQPLLNKVSIPWHLR